MANGKKIYKNKRDEFKRNSFLGKGGNGSVYRVESLKKQYPYALVVKELRRNCSNKRKRRFKKEIETVLSIQNDMNGILPIAAYSLEVNEMWYAMPEAIKVQTGFINVAATLEYKIEVFIELAQIIKTLHSKGLYHRDIKPDNILFYEGKVYLSDFGLVFSDDGRLTDTSETIGPVFIRPPELEHGVKEINDFSPSDVYLFAKTIWMLIKNDGYGFRHQYTRENTNHYLKKEDYGVDTLEPIHRLMEGATENEMGKRINIDQIIMLLTEQLLVVRGECEYVENLEMQERFSEIPFSIASNGVVYTQHDNIMKIISDILKYTEKQILITEDDTSISMNFLHSKIFGDPYEKIFSFNDRRGFEVLLKINRIIFEEKQSFIIETELLEKIEGYQSIFLMEDNLFLENKHNYFVPTPARIECHPRHCHRK